LNLPKALPEQRSKLNIVVKPDIKSLHFILSKGCIQHLKEENAFYLKKKDQAAHSNSWVFQIVPILSMDEAAELKK